MWGSEGGFELEVKGGELAEASPFGRLRRLFFLQPPPTATFLRVPPRVQYRLQALQKCLGCDKL